MIDSIGLEGLEDSFETKTLEVVNRKNIYPSEGYFLGLDISEESTGLCFVENGSSTTGNITLNDELKEILKSDKACHWETLLRRELKKNLLELINGIDFEVIVVEDVFSGVNAKTTRMLYALNTAIDELILDGYCSCKDFVRVSNKVWKSWLYEVADPAKKFRVLTDKMRIESCLGELGIIEDHIKGYQDRLDATGMLIGYLLKGSKKKDEMSRPHIAWSDIEFSFCMDTSDILEGSEDWVSVDRVSFIHLNRLTKKVILEIVNSDYSRVYITDDLVSLGALGIKIKTDMIGEGYLGFWVKRSKRRKIGLEE